MSSYFEPTSSAPWLTGATTSVPIVLPNDVTAGPAALTSGAGNVYGVYTQITAAAVLTAHMLIGFAFNLNSAGNSCVVDIATGGAGAEVVIGSWPQINLSAAGLSGYFPVIPFLIIPANARVAARIVSNAAGVGAQMMCVFIPRPLA